MLRGARQLFSVNLLQLVAGLLTGVLTARALGPSGRGELAAVLVVLGTLPYVLAFGLTTYAAREVARGTEVGRVLGTTGAMAGVIGLLSIIPGLWLGQVIAAGRRDVADLIAVGVILMPLSLVASVVLAIAAGLERWDLFARQKGLAVLIAASAYLVLFVAGELSVVAAAIVAIIAGVLCLWPVVTVVRSAWPLRIDRRLAREAAHFGVRASPITLSQLLNHRLDQIVMAPLVSSRALGLYAVAVTIAGLTGLISSAVAPVLLPRAARGTDVATGRSVRLGILATLGMVLPIAVASPVVLEFLFGPAFLAAYPLVIVLLAASVPLAGVSFFISIYTAQNKLGAAGWSEIVSLVVTVVGLLLLVQPLGAMGAALVSLAAYTVNFVWLAAVVPRSLGGRIRDYLVPTRQDIADLWREVGRYLRRWRGSPAGS